MILDGEVVTHLQSLFERCNSMVELPHSFDDTLVDKLVDHIDCANKDVAEYILDGLRSFEPSQMSPVCLSLFARLVDKFIKTMSADSTAASPMDEVLLNKFLGDTEVCLSGEDYPQLTPKLACDLLQLYSTCYKQRLSQDWSVVVEWCLESLEDESISVFVRREIEKFVILSDISASNVDYISSLFQVESALLRDSISRILIAYHSSITPAAVQRIVVKVRELAIVGYSTCTLVALISSRAPPSLNLLNRDQWNSQLALVSIILEIIRLYPASDSIRPMVETVVGSECAKLHHIVSLMPFLTDSELMQWLPKISNRRLAPMSDLARFVGSVARRETISRDKLAEVIDKCSGRWMESPTLIQELAAAVGPQCFDWPEFGGVSQKLRDCLSSGITDSAWEVRDTAIEIAMAIPSMIPCLGELSLLVRSDASPYVRAAALRCLIMTSSDVERLQLAELCETVARRDADPEPRLTAITYISTCLPLSIPIAHRLLPSSIEDSDFDVRRLTLFMCPSLLAHSQFAESTRQELEHWKEDAELGSEVRQMLGDSEVAAVDPSLRILTDMLTALRIDYDDVIDCY